MEDLLLKLTPFLSKYRLPLSVGILGVMLFGYGLMTLLLSSPVKQSDIVFTPSQENVPAVKSATDIRQQIVVDVSGAVIKPDLYHLPEGARMQDALVAAGGLSAEADRDLIARQINLAAKLVDGQKIYIPKEGEKMQSSTSTTGTTSLTTSGQAGSTSFGNVSSQININAASESELDTLPGIGQVTAGKIINNRPYNKIEELLEKKVVSKSVFEKIKDKLTIY